MKSPENAEAMVVSAYAIFTTAEDINSSFSMWNFDVRSDDAYVMYNRLGAHNHISLKVTTSNNWDKFGISLVRGTDSKKYYTMVVNPEWENGRKVNFEQEGEEGKGFVEGIDGYNFQRPLFLFYTQIIVHC